MFDWTEAATKGVLKNFAKFKWKHLCQSLFFIKVEDLRPVTLSKKTTWQVLSCECCEISKNSFFTEHLQMIAFDRILNMFMVNMQVSPVEILPNLKKN